jgi:hypothetical protein
MELKSSTGIALAISDPNVRNDSNEKILAFLTPIPNVCPLDHACKKKDMTKKTVEIVEKNNSTPANCEPSDTSIGRILIRSMEIAAQSNDWSKKSVA